jgi:hypothetical protein
MRVMAESPRPQFSAPPLSGAPPVEGQPAGRPGMIDAFKRFCG